MYDEKRPSALPTALEIICVLWVLVLDAADRSRIGFRTDAVDK